MMYFFELFIRQYGNNNCLLKKTRNYSNKTKLNFLQIKKMKIYIMSLFFLLFAFTTIAQNKGSINGTVIDAETGKGIPNAEVLVVETSQGTVVSENGTFEINNIEPGTYTVYTHVMGYVNDTLSNIRVEAEMHTKIKFSIKTENVKLGEVTVSATKTDKTVKAIGSPIYIIGKKRIEQTDGRNISEALIAIPGVFTEDTQHSEASVVSFRGVGLHTYVTRGILVLVDGIPITEAMGRTSFEGIDMQNAEKIEVLKGPVSALYGPNGLTGVINVIEKKPRNGLHGDIEGLVGSYGTGKISANINGGNNGFNYLFKANYYKSDGYRDHSAYDATHMGVKLSKDLKASGKLKFTFDYSLSDSELAGSLDSITFVEDPTAASRKFAGYNKKLYRAYLDYTKTWNNNSLLTIDVYTRGRNDEGHYTDATWGKYDVDLFGGEGRYNTRFDLFGQKNTITVGGKFDREQSDVEEYSRDEDTGIIGDLEDKGKVIYDMSGFYIEDEFNISNKLFLTLGLRYDLIAYEWKDQFNEGSDNTSDNKTLDAFSPKFGFAYNPTDRLTVFGNIGKGFNPPTYDQMFIGGGSAAPNPDLNPEYLTNYEIGLRGNLMNKLNYQVSYFLMDFVDQIATEPDPDSPGDEIYENVGDTRHKGVEASVNYQINKEFSAFVSYSYLDARFTKDPDDELVGNRLKKAPYNQYSLGARYNFNFGLAVSADYKYVGEYQMDNENMFMYEGYSLLNAKLMYRLKRFRASFAVNNLLDEKYAARAYAAKYRTWRQYYSPGWPRNFTFTLGYNF